jgi:hypothetical protein
MLRVLITRRLVVSNYRRRHNVFAPNRLGALSMSWHRTWYRASKGVVAEAVMSSPPDSEPRPDLRHVLSALVAGLRRMSPDRDLQAVFEHELQQLLSM